MSEPFLWGAATSSHQIEGGNDRNDWWAWEAEGNIEGGVRSGAAADHWNRWREDLEIAAGLGLSSYRFSVEWSRVEPEEGRFDQTALDWYEALVMECERLGLLPMLTLHHFTLPLWLAKRGGVTSQDFPKLFERFTAAVIGRLGARIPLWCTLNEPLALALGSYIGRFMPPAEFSPERAALATSRLLSAHALAYDLIHRKIPTRTGPWAEHPLRVGIAHNMMDFQPDRAWHPFERLLSHVLGRFYNRAWLDAITGRKQRFGVPGLLPEAPHSKEAAGRPTADFIGVNYYTKALVQWRPMDRSAGTSSELPVGIAFARRKEPVSDVGWSIHPEGFRKVLRIAGSYGLPLYVTENGIADATDALRQTFLTEHLRVLQEEQARGVPLFGYYHWSLIDNFEWIKGFKPRFGLVRVDYESFERKPNPSAALYSQWIQSKQPVRGESPQELGKNERGDSRRSDPAERVSPRPG